MILEIMNIILLILIVVSDQLIKSCIRLVPTGTMLFSLPPFFRIIHTVNTGAAFSIFRGNIWLILILSIILLAALCIVVVRFMNLTRPASVAFFCLLGGGIGNLIDRLFYKSVTDYIQLLFIDFPVFNLADIAITLSIIILMILLMTGHLENS